MPKILDFLATCTAKVKGPCSLKFQPRKLQYGPNLLAGNGGPKMSVTQMIKNQSRQIFELTAKVWC